MHRFASLKSPLIVGVAALLATACGSPARPGAAPAAAERPALALTPGETTLGQPASFEGDMALADSGSYTLDGAFLFTVDVAREVTLKKLYGAAACAADEVKLAPARFVVRGGAGADEASGSLAAGADQQALGRLTPGAYTLNFHVEGSAPCSVALAFVNEPLEG